MSILNRSRLLLQLALVLAVLVLLEGVALAQTGAPLPVTALTPYSVIVTALTLAAGILTTAINTGRVAGKQIPASAMVWLLIVAPFVGAAGTTLTAAGALTAVSAFNALVAGLVAVTGGAAPGLVVHAALHAHLAVPKLAAAWRATSKGAGAALLVAGLGALCVAPSACTTQQAKTADGIAIDLTNAVCAPLENQPAGQPYIDIVCTIAQGIEQTANGVVSALPNVKTVQIRMPASEAPAFLAAHKGPKS